MSPAEYARHLGLSKMAVSKALAAGRLDSAIVRDAVTGKVTIPDVAAADRAWEASKRGGTSSHVAAARAPSPRETPRSQARQRVTPEPEPEPTGARPHGIPPLATSIARKEAAAARAMEARAAGAELQLAKLRSKVQPTDAIRAEVDAAFALVKQRVLGVPTQLVLRRPDLADAVPIIDGLLREALADLADSKGRAA